MSIATIGFPMPTAQELAEALIRQSWLVAYVEAQFMARPYTILPWENPYDSPLTFNYHTRVYQ